MLKQFGAVIVAAAVAVTAATTVAADDTSNNSSPENIGSSRAPTFSGWIIQIAATRTQASALAILRRASAREPKLLANAVPYAEVAVNEGVRCEAPLLFEVQTFPNGRVRLGLTMGPSDQSLRATLYGAASERRDVFRGLQKPMGQQWATIYTRDLLTANQAREMDRDVMHATVSSNWKDFVDKDLPLLTEAVLEIVNRISPQPD